MGAFFVYILKATICLAAFYLFYRLLLSKETFHRFNRIAVLGILALSLIIPLCEITLEKETEMQQTFLTLEQILLLADMQPEVVPQTETTTVSYIQVVLIVYLVGIFFFFCRNIYCLIKLCILLHSGTKERLMDGTRLIIHNNPDSSPFSWIKFIVISQKDLDENGREILIHELAHIRNRHSIDLLIADICIFFQWFNPAAWLLKQELQTIHEYQADETVIREGVNAKQYQLLLIKKAVGTRLYSMANSFNHSKLKKRITMMLKEKSSPWARLKCLYVLPIAAIAITAFARPEISKELQEISAVKVNDLTAIVETNNVENQSEFKSSLVNEDTIFVYNAQYIPDEDSDMLVNIEKEYIVSEVREVISLQDPQDKQKPKETESEVVVVGYGSTSEYPTMVLDSLPDGKKPLIVIDGEVMPNEMLNSVDPETIKSISVLKGNNLPEQYITMGKNGVILVTTKRNNALTPPKKIQLGTYNLNDELYIDGKKVDNPTMNSLSEDQIQSFIMEQVGDKKHIKVITKDYAKNNPITVQGNVKDKDGKPIIGANVVIWGSNVGTITDLDGNFILKASPEDEIVISYIDKESKRIKATNSKVEIILE